MPRRTCSRRAEEYKTALGESGAQGGVDSALLTLKIADLGLPHGTGSAAHRPTCFADRRRRQTLMRSASRCAFAALAHRRRLQQGQGCRAAGRSWSKFPATLPVKELWGDKVGGGKKQVKLRLGLGPAVDNGLVFAASDKGELLAVNLNTGRQVWVKKFKSAVSPPGPAPAWGWWWSARARVR